MKKVKLFDNGMSKGAPKEIFAFAHELRKSSTEAEVILWEKLKNNQLDDFKFRRQHPIGVYIADFYCHRLKLIIEVDGDYHLTQKQTGKDTERTAYLNANGVQVIRFTNNEVLHKIDQVLEAIRLKITEIDSQNNHLTQNHS